jgi:hypothetical protein
MENKYGFCFLRSPLWIFPISSVHRSMRREHGFLLMMDGGRIRLLLLFSLWIMDDDDFLNLFCTPKHGFVSSSLGRGGFHDGYFSILSSGFYMLRLKLA